MSCKGVGKEAAVTYTEELYWPLSGRTEGNHKNRMADLLGQYLNVTFPTHETEVLLSPVQHLLKIMSATFRTKRVACFTCFLCCV